MKKEAHKKTRLVKRSIRNTSALRRLPIFLGVAHRAQRRDGAWDLLQLSDNLFAPFFPQTLRDLALVFAVRGVLKGRAPQHIKIALRNELHPNLGGLWNVVLTSGTELAQVVKPMGIAPFVSTSDSAQTISSGVARAFRGSVEAPPYHLIVLPTPAFHLECPTNFSVSVQIGRKDFQIGAFYIHFLAPAPMTDEESRALQARPNAPQSVQMGIKCKVCGDQVCVYASLVRGVHPKGVPSDAVRIEEAPDEWNCRCGNGRNFRYLKAGMHDVLRRAVKKEQFGTPAFKVAYEEGAVDRLLKEYHKLIHADVAEEDVQRFLEKHPAFWGFLSPVRILHKPRILTKKTADFGILTSDKILYLIEIEKPKTPLVKQSGGVHAALQAGLNQIADWNVVVEDKRNALLSELGLREEEVHDIRFMLIAGLASKTADSALTTLRRKRIYGTQLYCFDELATFVQRFANELSAL